MRLTKNFTSTEFECPCCKRSAMDMDFIKLLQRARSKAKMPFRINSGYRCVKHNAAIGGVPNSSHLRGLAADIDCWDTYRRYRTIQALIEAGIVRIGISDTFVHGDVDILTKRYPRLWTY